MDKISSMLSRLVIFTIIVLSALSAQGCEEYLDMPELQAFGIALTITAPSDPQVTRRC